jgi:hypothetical protein
MAPNREIEERAELKMMRETLPVLVQAVTDLLACLPRDSYPTERIANIEYRSIACRGAKASSLGSDIVGVRRKNNARGVGAGKIRGVQGRRLKKGR